MPNSAKYATASDWSSGSSNSDRERTHENPKNLKISRNIVAPYEKSKVHEIEFDIHDDERKVWKLSIKERSAVILKVKKIFDEFVLRPKRDFSPRIGDLIVGRPFGVSITGRMTDTTAPGGSVKRALLYKMGGMSEVKEDSWQYGKYVFQGLGIRITSI